MAANAAAVSFAESIVLGVVQGLSEFLPISSTAHLRVVPALLGWGDPGAAYSAVIQLGSVLAVLIFFWKDIFQIATGSLSSLIKKDYASRDFRLAVAIILGTIPICVIGLLLKHAIEDPSGPFRSLYVIGGAAIFMGAFLLVAEKVARRERTIETVGIKDGILMGLGQALALVPGCSRSGSTLTVALFLNMKREDAARFSFLLGIPAIVLSGLLELKELLQQGLGGQGLTSLAVGLLVSAIVSYLAIWWMLRFLGNHSTMIFIVYRFIFGALVIGLSLAGLIH